MSYDEFKNTVMELATYHKQSDVKDTQEFLCSEGITGSFVYDNIPLEIIVRLNLWNGWTKHDETIKTILFFIMHIWNIEDIYRKFGVNAVDKLAYN